MTPPPLSTWTTTAGDSLCFLRRFTTNTKLNFKIIDFEKQQKLKGLKRGDDDSQPLQVKVGGVTRYHTVGYSTVYEYYAYGREVNKKRPRIAQMVLNEL